MSFFDEPDISNDFGQYNIPAVGARFVKPPDRSVPQLEQDAVGKFEAVMLLKQRQVPSFPTPRKLDSDPPSESKHFEVLRLVHNEDKALFRFLRVLSESLLGKTSISHIFSVGRFAMYTTRRDDKKKLAPVLGLEVELHGFVDTVNYVLVKTLAQIRLIATKPAVKRIQLMDILMNDAASQHYAALVTLLWKDSLLDRGLRYQNGFVVAEADETHRRDMEYFRSLASIPASDMLFQDEELSKFIDGGAFISNDADMFVTPAHPYLFFLRITMQAMHYHRLDDLRRVFDNVLAIDTNTEDSKFTDITVAQLQGPVFLDSGVYGFKEAMTLATAAISREKRLSNTELLEWMRRDIDSIAFVAHLVASCANFHSMAEGKADARQVIAQRLRLVIDRLVQWVAYMYRAR
jgi:hypothetical protein